MNIKKSTIIIILMLALLLSVSTVAATMEIEKVKITTGSALEDKTYADIYVGSRYSGENVIIQIYYSVTGLF